MGPCLPLVMPVSPRSFAGFAQQCSELSCASAVLLLLLCLCCALCVEWEAAQGSGQRVGGSVAVGSLWTAVSKCVVVMEKSQC